MPEPAKPAGNRRISVITNAKGQVIATDFRMTSGRSNERGPGQCRIVPLKGQRLHAVDLPADLELPTARSSDSAVADFHKYLRRLLKSASAKRRPARKGR